MISNDFRSKQNLATSPNIKALELTNQLRTGYKPLTFTKSTLNLLTGASISESSKTSILIFTFLCSASKALFEAPQRSAKIKIHNNLPSLRPGSGQGGLSGPLIGGGFN